MSRTSDTAHNKAQAIRESAAGVSENIRDIGGKVREAATDKYNELRDQAGQYYDEGRERAIEWERGIEEYVQEKPIRSLLIAAGVGMLLGMIWRRR